MIVTIIVTISGVNTSFADHTGTLPEWTADQTYDVSSSLDDVSHASFTPDADFDDSIDVWNNVSTNWFDLTRNDSTGKIDVGSHSFGWFSTTLAETEMEWLEPSMVMTDADIEFNTEIDFRDVNVSQGWYSYDFESVAVHEIGHASGIYEHTTTSSSPMQEFHSINTVDRTLNSHDISTIGGMY